MQRVQVEPDRKDWGRLVDMYHEYDQNRIRAANEDIDALLVFVSILVLVIDNFSNVDDHVLEAGLFSAVLSAFLVETYPTLQEDPADTTNQILFRISSQLSSQIVSGSFINSTIPALAPTNSFSAPPSSIVVNTLWSCSLAISLITASLGILVKQWFHEFTAQGTQDPSIVFVFVSSEFKGWKGGRFSK